MTFFIVCCACIEATVHMKKHVETRIELDGFFFAVLRIICIATTQNVVVFYIFTYSKLLVICVMKLLHLFRVACGVYSANVFRCLVEALKLLLPFDVLFVDILRTKKERTVRRNVIIAVLLVVTCFRPSRGFSCGDQKCDNTIQFLLQIYSLH